MTSHTDELVTFPHPTTSARAATILAVAPGVVAVVATYFDPDTGGHHQVTYETQDGEDQVAAKDRLLAVVHATDDKAYFAA